MRLLNILIENNFFSVFSSPEPPPEGDITFVQPPTDNIQTRTVNPQLSTDNLHYPPRHTHHRRTIRDIFDDDRTRTDGAPLPDFNAGYYDSSSANMRTLSYGNITGKNRMRG